MTKVVNSSEMNEIISTIKNGKVVAFPTETVYGLGVKFGSVEALDLLMEAKNREYSKAITLMVANKQEIENYAYVSHDAKKIISRFMPGMLTLVFKKKENVDSKMTNGKETIGIRIPDNDFVLSLLKEAGPMLVTSANLSNHPNTVIDVSGKDIKILREGKITQKQIEEVIK